MALKKELNHMGIDLPEGYHRIGALRFDEPERVYIRVDTFATADEAASENGPIKMTNVETTLSDMSASKASLTIKKAYTCLKSRDEFVDAEDV